MSDDKFGSFPLNYDQPPKHHFAITPSDTDDLANIPRSIYVGTGGDVEAVMSDGGTVIYKNLPSGYELYGAFQKIKASSTTASNLIGRY